MLTSCKATSNAINASNASKASKAGNLRIPYSEGRAAFFRPNSEISYVGDTKHAAAKAVDAAAAATAAAAEAASELQASHTVMACQLNCTILPYVAIALSNSMPSSATVTYCNLSASPAH